MAAWRGDGRTIGSVTVDGTDGIRGAQVVLPGRPLDETVQFFTTRLGFRVDAISPADDPARAVLSGHGTTLRLDRDAPGSAGVLRVLCDDPALVGGGVTELTAPNGTRVELVAADPPIVLPPQHQTFVHSTLTGPEGWVVGRAGMRYRDLIPDRQGGRFIASHIVIPEGGPVPDYVHHHHVRFQMIYCYRGWVRVVYEDQGEPVLMEAGDCVLQPPHIRHRVLESSADLHVIEVGCPAVHDTLADRTMTLPTPHVRPERNWVGQRFVYHDASAASWSAWRIAGYEHRDTGIAAATGGLAGVRVARPTAGAASPAGLAAHGGELAFWFVLDGSVTLRRDGDHDLRLATADSVVIPAGMGVGLADPSPDLELLDVSLPAELPVA